MRRQLSFLLAATLVLWATNVRAELLIDPTGGTVLFDGTKGADDEVSPGRVLSFPFSFFGDDDNPFEEVDVSVNGNLNFSSDAEFTNKPMPSDTAGRISALWDDLEVAAGSTDSIIEKTKPGAWYSVTWSVRGSKLGAHHTFQVVLFGQRTQIGHLVFQPNDVVLAYREIGTLFEKTTATIGLDAGDADRFVTAPNLTSAGGILSSGNGPAVLALGGGMLLFRANDDGLYDLPMLTNRPPLAAEDVGFTNATSSGTLTLPVLLNDSDEDGNELMASGVTQGAAGAVTLLADGTVTYAPGNGYIGHDEFTYTVEDGLGGATVGKVSIIPFTKAAGIYEGPWRGEDLEPLGRVKLTVDGAGHFTGVLTVDETKTPFGGTFDAAGRYQGVAGDPEAFSSFDVTLALEYRQGAIRVTGTVDDGSGPAALLAPLGGNNPPTARDTLAYLRGKASVRVSVLPLATDLDGDTLRVSAVTQGTSGSVAIQPEGTVIYTPGPVRSSTDRFSYTVADPSGLTATAFVTVLAYGHAGGNYDGLVQLADEDGGLLPEGTGRLRVSVSGGGRFTAVLWYAGRRQNVTGRFDSAGRFAQDLPTDPALHLELALDLTNDTNQVTGTVFDGENTSQITAGKSRYQAASLPAPQAGAYTVLFDPDGTDAPAGVGFARLQISKGGRARFRGKLGDGKPFTLSAPLLVDGTLPFYLTKRIKKSLQAGFLAGTLRFQQTVAGSDLAGSLLWTRPDVDESDVPGFSAVLATTGAKYVAPGPGQPLLDLGRSRDNAEVVLDGEPVPVTIEPNATVVVSEPGERKLSVQIQTLTGIFSGSFLETTSDPVTGGDVIVQRKFSGALLPRQQRGAGVIPLGEDGPRPVRIERPEVVE